MLITMIITAALLFCLLAVSSAQVTDCTIMIQPIESLTRGGTVRGDNSCVIPQITNSSFCSLSNGNAIGVNLAGDPWTPANGLVAFYQEIPKGITSMATMSGPIADPSSGTSIWQSVMAYATGTQQYGWTIIASCKH